MSKNEISSVRPPCDEGASLDLVLRSDIDFFVNGEAGDRGTGVLAEFVLDDAGLPKLFKIKRWLCSDCLRKASKSGFDSTGT